MLCDFRNPEIRPSEHPRRLHHMDACDPQDMLGQGHVGQVSTAFWVGCVSYTVALAALAYGARTLD